MQNGSRAFRCLSALAALAPIFVATQSLAAVETGDGAITSEVAITVVGLRSERGQVLACLTSDPKAFPDCGKDPAARKLVVPARRVTYLTFTDVPPGVYAVTLLHDENGNGKADTVLMVPREGYGFSRGAHSTFGPPPFSAAAFDVSGPLVQTTIRMRYIF